MAHSPNLAHSPMLSSLQGFHRSKNLVEREQWHYLHATTFLDLRGALVPRHWIGWLIPKHKAGQALHWAPGPNTDMQGNTKGWPKAESWQEEGWEGAMPGPRAQSRWEGAVLDPQDPILRCRSRKGHAGPQSLTAAQRTTNWPWATHLDHGDKKPPKNQQRTPLNYLCQKFRIFFITLLHSTA